MDTTNNNIAETLAREMKKPEILFKNTAGNSIVVALPNGWATEEIDLSLTEPTPRRAKCKITITDLDSFITTTKRYGSLASCNIYLDVDYAANKIQATAIFNDHGDASADGCTPGWRDHRAVLTPRFSKEWIDWTKADKQPMSQENFAHFLERNVGDIVQRDGMPSGSDVLTFVSQLEEVRKVKYGSAINLQNGMVAINFVEEGDSATKGKLEVFKRFSIGIRPFFAGNAYQLDALLRYRIDRNTGDIGFWYELQKPDRILEDASKDVIECIRTNRLPRHLRHTRPVTLHQAGHQAGFEKGI